MLKKTLLAVLAATLTGCGGEGYEPYQCLDSGLFGAVVSSEPIDCDVVRQNTKLAIDQLHTTLLPEVEYRSDMSKVTVHILRVQAIQCSSSTGWCAGLTRNAWDIDLSANATALLHESFHAHDAQHLKLDSSNHPGWDQDCSINPVASCNFYAADRTYTATAARP